MKASTLLWATFPPPTIRLLKELSRFVAERGSHAYIVGGAVRDALLGVPTADIDIMLESELFGMVQEVKEGCTTILPATPRPHRIVTFPKYQTAKLLFPSEVVPGVEVIDFSGARKEVYPHPGAQPIVSPGTLEEDLKRRDFSINAMAVSLAPGRFGEVVDLFRGQEHLRSKTLAVLHPESFRDDPVRLVRGARFLTRFGFCWAPETSSLVQEATSGDYLNTVKPERRFDELRKALSEKHVALTVATLDELNLIPHLAPGAVLDARTQRILAQIESSARSGAVPLAGGVFEPWKLALVALFLGVSESYFVDALATMKLSARQFAELLRVRRELEAFHAS